MANTKRQLFLKRRMRVRNKLRAMANGRARLSVHRSSKNLSVQLIDDARPLAETLGVDEQCRSGDQGRRGDCRAGQEGRRGRVLF
jgi:ribosomal protein L18